MEHHDNDLLARRSLMAGMVIGVTGLVAGTKAANAQPGSARGATSFQPTRHALDAWFDELPGNHRVFVDTASAAGGADGVGYANNLYAATSSAYAGEAAAMAIVVCFRHQSTPFGYNDAIWKKYGEVFHSLMQYPDPATGAAPKLNLLNSATHKTLGNRGVTLDALAAKGAKFVICSTATRFFSSVIAERTAGKANDVFDELVANAAAGGRFVSAGVMALTRAQEYGYSLLAAG